MVKSNSIFLFLLVVLLFACSKKEQTDYELISELIVRYPQLSKDSSNEYELKRTVIVTDKRISLKLFYSKDENYKGQKILVLSDSLNKSYAIPLFSNINREFWNFENEPRTYPDKKFNSLFEKEFISAINKLNLNDSQGTGYKILFEIMYSLLHCQMVTEFDKEKMESFIQPVNNNELPHEAYIDCGTRIKKNYEQVLKEMLKSEHMSTYNAYYDQLNNRIYQFDFPQKKNKKINKLNIKVYRQDRIVHSLEM